MPQKQRMDDNNDDDDRMTDLPDDVTQDPEEIEIPDPEDVEHVGEMMDENPLVEAFGDSGRIRVLAAILVSHPRPLTVSRVKEKAGVASRQTVYNHIDALIDAGLVIDVSGENENRQLTVPDPNDDLRTSWLKHIHDWTAAYTRDGTRPSREIGEEGDIDWGFGE